MRDPDYDDVEPQLQLQEVETDITSNLQFEGVHKGVILMDCWGNEWDDTGELSEFDFRLVDGD